MNSFCLIEEHFAGWNPDASRPIRQTEPLAPEGTPIDRNAAIAALGILLYRYTGVTPVGLDLTVIPGCNGAVRRSVVELKATGSATAGSLAFTVSRAVPENASPESCVTCAIPQDVSRFLRIERTGSHGDDSFNVVFLRGRVLLQYAPDIYNEALVGRLAQHLEQLLIASLEPNRIVSEVPMMSARELNQVLVELNGAGTELKRSTIPEAFEAQVNRTPDAPALKFEGESITFRELQDRALRVAGALQQTGVRVETLVGVYMNDPIAVAITYFGIVIAGGVLVPLDPEWPQERLHQVIRNAAPHLIITEQAIATDLPSDSPLKLTYDELGRISAAHSFTRPVLTPDNAAYVLHTSGSTGVPKGVVGLHGTIPSAVSVAVPIAENEVFAVGTNLAFGAGVIGLFHALIQGAGIYVVSARLTRDLPRLVDAWERAAVTRVVMAAPQLRQLCALDGIRHRMRSLRTISHAGSALSADLLPIIYEAFPQATLINSYMSIEVGAAVSRWVSTPAKRRHTLSVGHILPNIRVYILNPDGAPVPLGMPGEIYVGSADLSRGYLNQPDRTRERFVPNPFRGSGFPRVYRAGDIGCLHLNGELEYLGRLDNQVKVRGMRVELEEVELFLHRHPDVNQCAVVAVAHEDDYRLTAFVSPKPGFKLSIAALRAHLASGLPHYCIPASFVLTDQLPMTRNGKIDRQNLPKIDVMRPQIETPFLEPRNSIERTIQMIWEQELGYKGIGVHDYFLELGGDSLLAVRISTALQERLGVEVPVDMLFHCPTIADLAQRLAAPSHADAAE